MKRAIELLRAKASALAKEPTNNPGRNAELSAACTEYLYAADFLDKLSQGDHGTNRVASAEMVDGRVIDERGLLTAALFVGINPKAAQQLVDLIMYIRNLESALQEKREQHAART